MTLRYFLQDIIFEACDRIVEAGFHVEFLKKQVISNQCLLSPPSASQDSQMDVDGEDTTSEHSGPFFGNEPRSLQPLLKRNRRRHESHQLKSTLDASLIQVKAIRQKLNGACGYYSLFHSSMTIVARECLHEEHALYVLRQTFNKAVFFVMMAHWKAQLLEHGETMHSAYKKGGGGGPLHITANMQHWKPSLIKTGVVERAYMDYLVEHDEFIGAIKRWTGATYHALPEISLSQLKSRLSIATLSTVDSISKQLLKDHKPHAFLIGQLNHWITIVSNRVLVQDEEEESGDQENGDIDQPSQNSMDIDESPQSKKKTKTSKEAQEERSGDQRKHKKKNQEEERKLQLSTSSPSGAAQVTPSRKPLRTKVETILLDSRNDFVLNMTPEDIPKRVCKRVQREFIPTGSLWHDMCIRLYEQSLRDTQYSCDMFHALSSQQIVVDTSAIEDFDGGEKKKDGGSRSKSRSNSKSKTDRATSLMVVDKGDDGGDSAPHPVTTELVLLYVAGFFESYSSHVSDPVTIQGLASSAPAKTSKSKKSTSSTNFSSSGSPTPSSSTSLGSFLSSPSPLPLRSPEDDLMDVADISEWLFKFTMWVQEHTPLVTIEDNFIQSLRNVKRAGYNIPECVPSTIEHWVAMLQRRLDQLSWKQETQQEEQGEVVEGSNAILHDLSTYTIPVLLKACKYFRRK